MGRLHIGTISVISALSLGLTSAFAASPAPVEAEHGMVVTAQHLATDVGVEVLKSLSLIHI